MRDYGFTMTEKHRPAILQSSHSQLPSSTETCAANEQVHYVIEQGVNKHVSVDLPSSQNGKTQVFLVCEDTYTCGFCNQHFTHLPQFLAHKAHHAIGDSLYKCDLCEEVHGGESCMKEHYTSVHNVCFTAAPVILSSIEHMQNRTSLNENGPSSKVNEVQVTLLQTKDKEVEKQVQDKDQMKKILPSVKRKAGRPPKRKAAHEVRMIQDESGKSDLESPENSETPEIVISSNTGDDQGSMDTDKDCSHSQGLNDISSIDVSKSSTEGVNIDDDFLFFLLTEHVKGRTVQYERQWLQCFHCSVQTRTKNMLVKHMKEQHVAFLSSSQTIDQAMLEARKAAFEKPRVKVQPMLMSMYTVLHCNEGKARRQPGPKKRQRNIEKQDIPGAYPCSQCGKVFSRLRYLRKHADTHRTSKEYICDVCGKSFKSRTYLRVHRRVHQEKVFSCNQCNFRSSNNASIHMHRQIHSQGSVLCDICGYAYTDRSTLNKHKRVHDLSRPFACNYPGCMWRFKSEIMCKAHIRAHYTEGKFRCLYCGYVFRHKHHLLRHESNIHGVKNEKTSAVQTCEVSDNPSEIVPAATLESDSVNIVISSDLMGQQLTLGNCALVVANDNNGTPITYETTDISAAYEALIKTEGSGQDEVGSLTADDHVNTVLMTTEEEIDF